VVDSKPMLSGSVMRFRAKPGASTEVMLSVELTGRSVNLDWRGMSGRAGRVTLSIPDATYRTGQEFRYQATFHDGRTHSGRVNFDPQWTEPTRADLKALTLRHPVSDVTFKAISPAGSWDFIDARKFGHGKGGDRLELATVITPPAARGRGWHRRLEVTFASGERFEPVDLRKVVNRGFTDEHDADGKGGWTDQGGNDLRNFPVGPSCYLGVPFDVIDPSNNNNKSAILLHSSYRIEFPRQAEARVGRKFRSLHILHAGAWARPGQLTAKYILKYADGTHTAFDVIAGRDLLDWWGDTQLPAGTLVKGAKKNFEIAWVGRNGDGTHRVRMMVTTWQNPHPEKLVKSIVFKSNSLGVPCIVAVTTSTGDYRAAGTPVVPKKKDLPLTPLYIRCQGPWWSSLDPVGFPHSVTASLKDLSERTDLVFLGGTVSDDEVAKLVDYVKQGGHVMIDARLEAVRNLGRLLPFDPTRSQVKKTPEKWGILVPKDVSHPAFSGLPWDRTLFNYPIPPVTDYVDVGRLDGRAKILATWCKGGPPALITWPVSKGRVTYLATDQIDLEPDGKRRLSGMIDYFLLKLLYWSAGKDQDATRVGQLAEAKLERIRIGDPYARCRALLEDAGSAVQFAGDGDLDKRLDAVDKTLIRIDEKTEQLDQAVLKLDFSKDPTAGYRALVDEIERQIDEIRKVRDDLSKKIAGRKDLTTYVPAAGPKLPTGIFLTMMDQCPGTVNGEYRQEAYLEHIKNLGFDVTMLYVSSWRENRKPGLLWEWKDGKLVYRFDHKPLQWFMDLCQRRGHKFIVQLSHSIRKGPTGRLWWPYLKACVEYFAPRDVVLAFEPNNEGVICEPATDADFRAFLKKRYGGVAELNAELGTSFKTFDRIKRPEMISLGGKKRGPKEAMKTKLGSPQRALYYEYMLFMMDWYEDALRRNYQIVKSVTDKPVNSRDTAIPERLHGGPYRLERHVPWHDSIGTHIQVPYDIERSRAFAKGKPLWLTEYYWHQCGGGWSGLRYRLHGSLMLPVAHVERENLAAVTRNFWMSVSRGTELFALYMAYPYCRKDLWDRGYTGVSSILWPDHSPKRPIYAHKYQRRIAERISGEIFGSRTRSKVAIVEPIASRIQLVGSVLEKTTGTIRYETKTMFNKLFERQIMVDPQPPTYDLSPYEYLYLPSGLCLARATQAKLIKFVQAGGTLVASLAPGLYDGHSKPDGRLLEKLKVEAVQLPFGDYLVRLGDEDLALPRAVVFTYTPKKGFKGKVVAKYANGKPCWIETRLGEGKVVLIGFAPSLSERVVREHVVPRCFGGARPTQWSLQGSKQIECFEKFKDGNMLLFVRNRDHKKIHKATLSFSRDRDVIDLRAGLKATNRKLIEMPRLLPGDCRIFKILP